MTHTITLIPGDGIGPEVTEAVLRILAATGVSIEWERFQAGVVAFERTGQALPVELIDSIRRNKVALKGPVTTPIGTGFTSVNVGLRKALDLYANLRPVWNLPGVASRFQGVDLVIVRENTEDLYAGLEHEVVPGVVESLKIITAQASTRISEFAFEYARRHGRKKVTAIHKANIMKLSDGLFLDCAREVSRQYPDIQYDEKIVDADVHAAGAEPVAVRRAGAGEPVRRHRVGSLRRPGRRARRRRRGESRAEIAVFEAVHGSAPDIAGKQLANPTALLLSAMLMLRHIDEGAAADRIMARGQRRAGRRPGAHARSRRHGVDARVRGRDRAEHQGSKRLSFGLWTFRLL